MNAATKFRTVEQCSSVDPVSGWRCEYPAGHDGLHACARYWGTVTVPGEIYAQWQQEAALQGRESGGEEKT